MSIVKLLKTFIVVVIFLIIITILVIFGKKTILMEDMKFADKVTTKGPVTQRYTSKGSSFGDMHYIAFNDVIGSAADMNKPVYYNLDLTIETKSEDIFKKISGNQAFTVDTIREVLGGYRFEEVSTAEGREYLKDQIRQRLLHVYGNDSIESVYIEKFLYQEY